VGAHWKLIASSWYVTSLIPGSEAERAGLMLGDEVLLADGKPFGPVTAFRGKAGTLVNLSIREARGAEARQISVKPSMVAPQDEFATVVAKGSRIITTPKHRVGYIPIFSWTHDDVQDEVVNAIVDLNRKKADTWILDLRDGFGGANPQFASIFSRDIVQQRLVDRDGKQLSIDTQIRGPAVLLINGGTRSGKELIAYGAKKWRTATLLGTRTAGAVLSGRPFCLSDGSLLFLAVNDVFVNGERLEGRGVAPDIEVPFDLRFAAGKDVQLAAALKFLDG
jgi:carboxyl-terminal processing protease